MIKNIVTQAVYVSDQEAAMKFWTQKLGFKVVNKQDMGNGSFWLEVAPEGAQTHLVLYPKSLMPDWKERRPSIVFECDNVDTVYKELQEQGVTVGNPPVQMSWGKFSIFVDLDGNEFIIKSQGDAK